MDFGAALNGSSTSDPLPYMDYKLVHLARVARRMLPVFLLGIGSVARAQTTVDGPLRMEVITAYNFVVDSNVETPASYSPSAAHLGVKIVNTGSTTLSRVKLSTRARQPFRGSWSTWATTIH